MALRNFHGLFIADAKLEKLRVIEQASSAGQPGGSGDGD
jgi:hypothetical protein